MYHRDCSWSHHTVFLVFFFFCFQCLFFRAWRWRMSLRLSKYMIMNHCVRQKENSLCLEDFWQGIWSETWDVPCLFPKTGGKCIHLLLLYDCFLHKEPKPHRYKNILISVLYENGKVFHMRRFLVITQKLFHYQEVKLSSLSPRRYFLTTMLKKSGSTLRADFMIFVSLGTCISNSWPCGQKSALGNGKSV